MIAPFVGLKRAYQNDLLKSSLSGAKKAGESDKVLDNMFGAGRRGKAAPPSLKKNENKALQTLFDKGSVPYEQRCRSTIDPNSDEFIEMQQYFQGLLRKTTVAAIMENHFNAHERAKFTPTNKAPFAEWQRQDTQTFDQQMNSAWKGQQPTLAFKMAMLWFGQTVAPMKMTANQQVDPRDFDDFDSDIFVTQDACDWLDEWDTRTWGGNYHEPKPGSQLGSIMVTTTKSALQLRRGGFGEDVMDIDDHVDDDDRSSVDWANQANNRLLASLRGGGEVPEPNVPLHGEPMSSDAVYTLYGRQGSVRYKATWDDLEWAVRLLVPGSEEAAVVDEFNKGKHVATHAAFDAVKERLRSYESKNRNFFVRSASDPTPKMLEPAPGDETVVPFHRLDDNSVWYMRIPKGAGSKNTTVQYRGEFLRTLANAARGAESSHLYFRIGSSKNPSQDLGTFYGKWGDPPKDLVDGILTTEPQSTLTLNIEKLNHYEVPIIVPGYNMSKNNKLKMTKDLSMDCNDLVGMLLNSVVDTTLVNRNGVKSVEFSLDEDFQLQQYAPNVITLNKGKADLAGAQTWKDFVSEGSKTEKWTTGFAIVARPVYHQYWTEDKDRHRYPVQLNELTLTAFKQWVARTMNLGFDPAKRTNFLELTTKGRLVQAESFVIRPDTTDAEWSFIKRRITEPVVQVVFHDDDIEKEWRFTTQFPLNPNQIFGACHDEEGLKEYGVFPSLPQTTDRFVRPPVVEDTNKRAQYYGRPAYNLGGEMTHSSMRQQAYWDPPSIFINPTKPVMPIHAPPIESMLRTGPSVPSVSLGMRTSTEMARLEKEVHTLRHQMMDRLRECPYNGCSETFHYKDRHELHDHIVKDHEVVRCALCPKNEQKRFNLYDSSRLQQHMLIDHKDMFRDMLGVGKNGPIDNDLLCGILQLPTPAFKGSPAYTKVLYRYCHRCGRDNALCAAKDDRKHHEDECLGGDGQSITRSKFTLFCKSCGGQREDGVSTCSNSECPLSLGPTAARGGHVDNFCPTCSFDYGKYMAAYKFQHRQGCKAGIGMDHDFCSFCGVTLADLQKPQRAKHMQDCVSRPIRRGEPCPLCHVTELDTPDEALEHFDEQHKLGDIDECPWCKGDFASSKWGYPEKLMHFAMHINQVGPPDTTQEMTDEERNEAAEKRKEREERNRMKAVLQSTGTQTRTGERKEFEGAPRSAGSKDLDHGLKVSLDAGGRQRSPSPDWDKELGPGSGPYMPEENMRCSKCFMHAPPKTLGATTRERWVKRHSDRNQVCRIRRGRGRLDDPVRPNRSGWVKLTKTAAAKAQKEFLERYPAYKCTLFPLSSKDPTDDPNFDNVARLTGKPEHLPWPPKESLVPSTKSRKRDLAEEDGPSRKRPRRCDVSPVDTVEVDEDFVPDATSEDDDIISGVDEETEETGGGRGRKKVSRRSHGPYDPTFHRPKGKEQEPEEEYIDADATGEVSFLGPELPPSVKRPHTTPQPEEIPAPAPMPAPKARGKTPRPAPVTTAIEYDPSAPRTKLDPITASAGWISPTLYSAKGAAASGKPGVPLIATPTTTTGTKTPGKPDTLTMPPPPATTTRKSTRTARPTRAAQEATAVSYADSNTEESATETKPTTTRGRGRKKADDGEFQTKTPARGRRAAAKKN